MNDAIVHSETLRATPTQLRANAQQASTKRAAIIKNDCDFGVVYYIRIGNTGTWNRKTLRSKASVTHFIANASANKGLNVRWDNKLGKGLVYGYETLATYSYSKSGDGYPHNFLIVHDWKLNRQVLICRKG